MARSKLNTDVLVPGAYVLPLLKLVERWNVSEHELLAGFNLTRESLENPDTRIEAGTYRDLVELARRMTREDGLALFMGLQLHVSSHGFLGFAMLSAATLRDALEVAQRYAPTRISAIGLELSIRGPEAALLMHEHQPLGHVQEFLVISMFVSFARIVRTLTGQDVAARVELALPEPSYYQRLAHLFPWPVKFGRHRHRFVLPASALDQPLVMADSVASKLAREQCERELDALGDASRSVNEVRRLLARDEGGFRTLGEVSRAMRMAPRTLKRHLASYGTTFSAALDRERETRAKALLRDRTISIDEIARTLGYADSSGFARAFRRWTGMPPKHFRRRPLT